MFWNKREKKILRSKGFNCRENCEEIGLIKVYWIWLKGDYCKFFRD